MTAEIKTLINPTDNTKQVLPRTVVNAVSDPTKNKTLAQIIDGIEQSVSSKAAKDYVDTEVAKKYTKPNTGIPKTDLASNVQTSLGKADSALQTHQDISGKADKTTVEGLKADITSLQRQNTEQACEIENLKFIAEGTIKNDHVAQTGVDDTLSTGNVAGSYKLPSGVNVAPNSEVNKVLGKSLCWNQMVQPSGYREDIDTSDFSVTVNRTTGTITINGTFSNYSYWGTAGYQDLGLRGNIVVAIISPKDMTRLYTGTDYFPFTSDMEIIKSNFTDDAYLYFIITGTFSNLTFRPMIVNLTKLFGVTETSQVTDGMKTFVKSYASAHPQYNAGSIISLKGAITCKSKGANLFDSSKSSAGYIDDGDGTLHPNSNFFCSDYIEVSQNTRYYTVTNAKYGAFYDSNKTFISGHSSWTSLQYVTSPSNAKYWRASFESSIGADNVCLTAFKSESYIPYMTPSSITLKDSIIEQLKSAGTVRDTFELNADGTSTLTQKVGTVDLGSNAVIWNSSEGDFLYADIDDIKLVPSTSTVPNVLLCGYTTVNQSNMWTNKTVFQFVGPERIGVNDSVYNNNPSGFKSDMSGKMLYYELATPVVTNYTEAQTTEILNNANRFLKVEKGGTITVSSNESYGDAEITYQTQITSTT